MARFLKDGDFGLSRQANRPFFSRELAAALRYLGDFDPDAWLVLADTPRDDWTRSSGATMEDAVSPGTVEMALKVVLLDALDEQASFARVGGDGVLPVGKYYIRVRAKDSAQVANDFAMKIRNDTDAVDILAEVTKTLTGAYAMYEAAFDIPATAAGDTITFSFKKKQGTANSIRIDYATIVPRGLGGAELTAGSVPYAGSDGTLTEENAEVFWDAATKRLGIGHNTPAVKADVAASPLVSGDGRWAAYLRDKAAFAAGVGAGVAFLGKFNAAGDYAAFGGVQAVKENATDGNSAGALDLLSTPNGGTPTRRVRLDSQGNLGIGIGTAVPAAKVHIGGFAGAVDGTKGVRLTNDAGTIVMLEIGASHDSYVGTVSPSSFHIRTTNLVRLTVKDDGLVGIGTAAPAAKLHVAADASVSGLISGHGLAVTPAVVVRRSRGTEAAPTAVADTDLLAQFAANARGATAYVTAGDMRFVVAGAPSGDSVPTDLAFRLMDSVGALTERVRFTTGGDVGIGATPLARLHVEGSAVSQLGIRLRNASASGRIWEFLAGGATPASGIPVGGLAVYDQSAGAARLAIDANGNVGLGTVPQVRLHVRGAAGQAIVAYVDRGDAPVDGNEVVLGFIHNSALTAAKAVGGVESVAASDGYFAIHTLRSGAAVERLRVDSLGNVRLGNAQELRWRNVAGTADIKALSVDGADRVALSWSDVAGSTTFIYHGAGGNTFIGDGTPTTTQYNVSSSADAHAWRTGAAERMRLTSTGLGIGVAAPSRRLHVLEADGASSNKALIQLASAASAAARPGVLFRRSRGTYAAPAAVVSGDEIWSVEGEAADAAGTFRYAAGMRAVHIGAPGSGTVTADILLETANAAGAATEKMRLTAAGNLVPVSDNVGQIGTDALRFNRIRAVTVVTGDMAFNDPNCVECGALFQVTNEVNLRIIAIEDSEHGNVLRTVPVHATGYGCRAGA